MSSFIRQLCFAVILCIAINNPHEVHLALPPPPVAYLSIQLRRLAVPLLNHFKKELSSFAVSPFGFSTTLAILRKGGSGETRKELSEVLRMDKDSSLRDPVASELYRKWLESTKNDNIYVASSVWVDRSVSVLQSYVSTIRSLFFADVKTVDFKSKAVGEKTTDAAVSNQIKEWARKKTNGKVNPHFQIPSSTKTNCVVVNVCYAPLNFDSKVDKFVTQQRKFKSLSGPQKMVKMMFFKGEFVYKHSYPDNKDGYNVVRIPFLKGKYDLFVIVPDRDDGIKELNKNITDNLEDYVSMNDYTKNVIVGIPEFAISSELKLFSHLHEVGLKSITQEGQADFSKIDQTKKLFVSELFQSVTVQVNIRDEHVNDIGDLNDPNFKQVIADHPFYFIFRQKEHWFWHFLGRVDQV